MARSLLIGPLSFTRTRRDAIKVRQICFLHLFPQQLKQPHHQHIVHPPTWPKTSAVTDVRRKESTAPRRAPRTLTLSRANTIACEYHSGTERKKKTDAEVAPEKIRLHRPFYVYQPSSVTTFTTIASSMHSKSRSTGALVLKLLREYRL